MTTAVVLFTAIALFRWVANEIKNAPTLCDECDDLIPSDEVEFHAWTHELAPLRH